MAAGSGPAKAEHRPEAIEEQQLIQVVAHFLAVRAIHDSYFIMRPSEFHHHVHDQVILQKYIGFAFRAKPSWACPRAKSGPRLATGKSEYRWDRPATTNARHDHVQHKHKDDDRGEQSACAGT